MLLHVCFYSAMRFSRQLISCATHLKHFNRQASSAASSSSMHVFDRVTKRRQREWSSQLPDLDIYRYLKDEVGWRLADRVFDIKRSFDVVLCLASGLGHIEKHLFKENCRFVLQADMSKGALSNSSVASELVFDRLVAEEELITFRNNSVDMVLCGLNTHWINDLPGFFRRVFAALCEDGVVLGVMPGGDTLFELRCSLQLAELERRGGISPHISPFVEAVDISGLLNRAGFQLLTIDTDEVEIGYPDMLSLMHDLQCMGESAAAKNRSLHLHRDVVLAASAIYKTVYGKTRDDGNVFLPATFSLVFFIGWKPSPTTPKPAKRGSGTVSLKDIGKLQEAGSFSSPAPGGSCGSKPK